MTTGRTSVLQTRLSPEHKRAVTQAAKLRSLTVSDYLRQVLVPMAQREVVGARQRVIEMTADEQLALWRALAAPAKLSRAQKKLARLMRGEA